LRDVLLNHVKWARIKKNRKNYYIVLKNCKLYPIQIEIYTEYPNISYKTRVEMNI